MITNRLDPSHIQIKSIKVLRLYDRCEHGHRLVYIVIDPGIERAIIGQQLDPMAHFPHHRDIHAMKQSFILCFLG